MNLNLHQLSASFAGGVAAGILTLAAQTACQAQPDPKWLGHDRLRPQPAAVNPGTASTQEKAGQPPSDAVVLFNGGNLDQWVSMDGSPTRWIAREDYMECVKGSGYIRTRQNFGDCQLHLEFAAPVPPDGEGQGRGNSGLFFGMGRYEIQILDSYKNVTYADGSAGSLYGQYPPLVNASRPPGQWQTYDVIYTAPRFDQQAKLVSPARVTLFHNGVLVQNNSELTGPTSWLERAPYSPHPEKTPIALQDHGNPVRFRNLWVRELGKTTPKEFTFGNAVLDRYVGRYETNVSFTREGDQLVLSLEGVKFTLFAESRTKFFAKTTDVQCEFTLDGEGKVAKAVITVGEGPGREAKKK